MPERPYEIFDVFTQERLAGNPLAVVHDAKGLDGEAMQRIAREFNLSETAFLFPPENPLHTAQVRIFTPDYEMPFAGHPTVGSAIALAEREYGEGATRILVLEEKVGPVRCGAFVKARGSGGRSSTCRARRPISGRPASGTRSPMRSA